MYQKIWKILTHQLLQYTNDTQWWYHSIKKRCKNSTKSKMIRFKKTAERCSRSDLHCISCGFVQQQTGLGHTKKPKKWGCLFCSALFRYVLCFLGEKTKNYDILSQKKSSESNHLHKYCTHQLHSGDFYHQLKWSWEKKTKKKSLTNLNLGGLTKFEALHESTPKNLVGASVENFSYILVSEEIDSPAFKRCFFSGGKRFPAVFLFLLVLSALTSRKCGGLRISKGTRTIPFPSVPGRRLQLAVGVWGRC